MRILQTPHRVVFEVTNLQHFVYVVAGSAATARQLAAERLNVPPSALMAAPVSYTDAARITTTSGNLIESFIKFLRIDRAATTILHTIGAGEGNAS